MLPIMEMEDEIECFIPCGELDPDTDKTPTWCEDISLQRLLPKVDIKQLYALRINGLGKMSASRNCDYTSIVEGQIQEGDF